MTKLWTMGLLSTLFLLIAGCVPECVKWDPAGDRGAVLSKTAITIFDENGKILSDIPVDASDFAWIDANHMLVARTENLNDWEAAKKILPEVDRQEIELNAETMRQRILKEGAGNWLYRDSRQNGPAIIALAKNAEVAAKGGDVWKKALALTTETGLKITSVCLMEETKGIWHEKYLVCGGLGETKLLTLSPDGKVCGLICQSSVIAQTREGGSQLSYSYDDGGGVVGFSNDGKSAFFSEGDQDKNQLVRRPILNNDGTLRKTLGAAVPIADRVLGDFAGDNVAELADGGILFVSKPDANRAAIYLAQPDGKKRELFDLPKDESVALPLFTVSPDDKWIAILSVKGYTAIRISDGKSIPLTNEKPATKILPVWKSKNVVTIGQLANQKAILVDVDLDTGKHLELGANWPEKVTQGLTDDKDSQK